MSWWPRLSYFLAGMSMAGAVWDFHEGHIGHAVVSLFVVALASLCARVLEAHDAAFAPVSSVTQIVEDVRAGK